MKKSYLIVVILSVIFIFENIHSRFGIANNFSLMKKGSEIVSGLSLLQSNKKQVIHKRSNKNKKVNDDKNIEITSNENYEYPKFYRGIYLNISSAMRFSRIKRFVRQAKRAHINTFVLDVQSHRYRKCIIPKKIVNYCIKNGIHPIARVVMFPHGLKYYPVPKRIIKAKLDIAASAARAGFKEIQFDYIRFNDSNRLRYLSLKKRYAFVEGFLARARLHLKKYNVKTAADVFGRIPLNRRDLIGQRMEGLDEVVDIICPMAYPSHYTWSKKLQYNPYYTVYKTSHMANERTKKAEIVTYIQGFRMRLGRIPFAKYIRDQIKACHDAKIRGFIIWNARQRYGTSFRVTRAYYNKQSEKKVTNR